MQSVNNSLDDFAKIMNEKINRKKIYFNMVSLNDNESN
jgi:hypothetical protein